MGFNQHFGMVTVVPVTSMEGKTRIPYPFEVVLSGAEVTPNHVGIAMPQKLRSISKARLLKKITTITDAAVQARIENRILEHLGIAFIEADSDLPSAALYFGSGSGDACSFVRVHLSPRSSCAALYRTREDNRVIGPPRLTTHHLPGCLTGDTLRYG